MMLDSERIWAHRKALGAGLALGIAGGTAWAVARAVGEHLEPRLINWAWARSVAQVASRARRDGVAWAREPAAREYDQLVERSVDLVERHTGVALPRPLTDVRVFDRAEWVEANIDNFRLMFAAIEEVYLRSLSRAAGRAALGVFSQLLLSGEVGALLGYLAGKVLGQYDLALLGREPLTGGRLYFVEPNVAGMVERHALPGREFRFWIALHETTHAFEFEAHPWVREHMNTMLTQYVSSLATDLFGTDGSRPLGALLQRLRDNILESRHVLELMMSPEQRRIFRHLQALMALMEGYSNHVMQRIGQQHIAHYQKLRMYFEQRSRQHGPAERLFIKLTGLDLKIEQYVLGERFVNHVVAQQGMPFMNRVWRSAEALPTLEEIRSPDRWITRMA